jgi:hypothetical protein
MKLQSIFLAIVFTIYTSIAFANADKQPTMKMEIIEGAHSKGFPFTIKITDIKTGKPITEDDLQVAHTKKLHLLVIDPSLTEYYHVHPTANTDGSWTGYFVPNKFNYRVWADVTRKDTGKQEYVVADIHNPTQEKIKIDQTVNLTSTVSEYKFELALDGELKAGEATMANITVSKNGKPFEMLEPVMGAFAHVVGFNEDYKSIMHIHPMGKEPETENEHGGAVLEFHIEPEKAGFIKLFAQFRINDKDVFVPFGVMVK